MKEIFTEYQKIFESYQNPKIKEHIQKIIELDTFFPFNATFFCITNTVNQSFEYVSKNFKSCTGLNANDLKTKGMAYFWSIFHPDDIEIWIESLKQLMHFTMSELTNEQRKKMSYTWNYRIKNAQGDYVNIIQNTTPLAFDNQHKPIIGLAHYTVLNNHINLDICASAKYLNDANEYETLYFKNMTTSKLLDVISNRERDIIRLLIQNKTSEDIGKTLFISKHTVDTHRRNILKKLQIRSTVELINYYKDKPSFI